MTDSLSPSQYAEKAVALRASGSCNCAQAVACAFAPVAGLSHDTLMHIAAPFGVGMGNMEGSCGALVGAGIILGLSGDGNRAAAMKDMKALNEAFAARCGSITCRCLKGADTGRPLASCPECVATAATLIAERLGEKGE